jgi:hypothetical protein
MKFCTREACHIDRPGFPALKKPRTLDRMAKSTIVSALRADANHP